jgi:DinB superfamily
MNANPYANDLGEREPLGALAETPWQIEKIVERWTTAEFDRSYAPGKWSARRILVHLAQTELALGTRVRFALAQDGYRAHSFNQDDWVPLDDHMDARTALNAYLALRQMNLAMWRNLREDQRNRSFEHPEYGALDVKWVAAQMAGHDIHHLRQIERIAGA